MIRPSRPFKSRRGFSLLEMAYALLVIGFVLGFIWLKAAAVYENFEVMQAGRELNLILLSIRQVHVNDKITSNENLDLLNLPTDMVGHFKGETILFSPWRGRVRLFSGNAMGWGSDSTNDEFTIRYDGIPTGACTDFVLGNTTRQMQALGLVAVAIAPAEGKGKEICFKSDSFCRNIVTIPPEGLVGTLCKEKNRMTVLFTFAGH